MIPTKHEMMRSVCPINRFKLLTRPKHIGYLLLLAELKP